MPTSAQPGDVLAHWLRTRSPSPVITSYGSDGSRVELSGATAVNAIYKAAHVFADELLLDPGDVVWLDLPCHWQAPVLAIGVWAAGLTVAIGAQPPSEAAATLAPAPWPDEPLGTGLAVSLHPFGMPLGADTPDGWDDFAALARVQPDAGVLRWPDPDQPWLAGAASTTGTELAAQSERLAEQWGLPQGGGLLSQLVPNTLVGLLACTLVPAVRGGSVILTDMTQTTAIERQERNQAVAIDV